jgi:bile acid:Na+ symporter, BASS family
VLFRPAGRRRAASIGLMSGNRNMGLMLGLAGGLGSGDLLLYLAVAQVPIYLSPLLAGPVYRRLCGPSRGM